MGQLSPNGTGHCAREHAASSSDASRRAVEELLRFLPEDAARFTDRSAAKGDWDGVVAAAREQGVLGVLVHYWRASGVRVPSVVSAIAERQCAIEQLWNEQVRASANEAMQALASNAVPCIPLKGPFLAERLYPDAVMRPNVDFDVLVDPRNVEAATDVLRSLGYRVEEGPSADYARRHKHHLNFSRPKTPDIELHFRVYAGFGTVLGADEAFSRSIEFRTARGAAVRILSPEDEVLYLALHAAGHSYVRLLWLYDLKLLLRQTPGIDWSAVESRARAHGVFSVLTFTLQLLADRLGAPVPRQFQSPLGFRARLAGRMLPTVMKPTVRSSRENFESLVFKSLLCDRTLTGLGLVGHHVSRSAKRRVQRVAPRLVPEGWAG